MMKKTKPVRLNNVIFPLFMLMVFSPILWLLIIAGNFLIDSLVIWMAVKFFDLPDFKALWKKTILKVVMYGFVADLLAGAINTVLLFGLETLRPGIYPQDIYNFPGCIQAALPAVILGGIFVYVFDRHFAFSKSGLSRKEIVKISLLLAFLTAPYLTMLPMNLWAF